MAKGLTYELVSEIYALCHALNRAGDAGRVWTPRTLGEFAEDRFGGATLSDLNFAQGRELAEVLSERLDDLKAGRAAKSARVGG